MADENSGAGASREESDRETAATVATRRGGRLTVELPARARGETIGRYTVLEVLGRGGMGVVYSAFDPDLDRRIALKVLRPSTAKNESGSLGRERMLREAQALAHVSHPNVVAVHDVGTFEGDVFIAMELVEGQTLRHWLRETERSLAEIIGVFAAAGDGLAAAHKAGLIHRDFKPDNVLVGDDGRVRVLDFGLARAPVTVSEYVPSSDDSQDSSPSHETLDSEERSSGSQDRLVDVRLTGANQVMGTPSYMAPEQFRLEPLSAATDQYSFCVALFEALYGKRPFKARGYRAMKQAVLRGEVREVSTDRRVPARLARVVRRGMSVEPGSRYPSMAELLAELRYDASALRRRAAAGVMVVALAGVVVFGLTRADSTDAVCESMGKGLEGVWDDDVKVRVKRAFLATGRPYADGTYALVARALDDYTASWVAMRTEACEATHVRGVQSGELLDLRMACTDRRRGQLAALTRLFAEEPTSEILDKAVDASRALSSLAPCADADALRQEFPLPENHERRAAIDRVQSDIHEGWALRNLGSFNEAFEIAKRAADAADEIDYPPLAAEALLLLASAQVDAGDAPGAKAVFERALRAAARAGDKARTVSAWLQYIDLLGTRLHQHEVALGLRAAAEAAIDAAGARRIDRARLDAVIGQVFAEANRLDEARANLERALAIQKEELAPDDRDVLSTLDELASVYRLQGDYEAAQASLEQVLAIYEQRLGPDHPVVGVMLHNLGLTFVSRGDYVGSRPYFERAIENLEAALGREHPNVATGLSQLAAVLAVLGDSDKALEYQQRALDIRVQALGPEDPQVASSLLHLGDLCRQRGEYDQAFEYLRRALTLREAVYEPNHRYIGESVAAIGELYWVQGRYAEARPYYDRTRAIYEVAYGPDHPFLAVMLLNLGECDLELGKPELAVGSLERSVAILEASESAPNRIADAQYSLALALWETGRGRRRAIAVAKKARDRYASAGERYDTTRDEIDKWIARATSSGASSTP